MSGTVKVPVPLAFVARTVMKGSDSWAEAAVVSASAPAAATSAQSLLDIGRCLSLPVHVTGAGSLGGQAPSEASATSVTATAGGEEAAEPEEGHSAGGGDDLVGAGTGRLVTRGQGEREAR